MNPLQAGAARTHITPPVGVYLCGFGGREGPSTGVHDDLRGCALYLHNGETELVIITAVIIGFSRDEVARIRAGVQDRTGVPPSNVMVSSSHTHSGPVTTGIRYLGEPDLEYLAATFAKLADLAAEARAKAVPAQAGTARVDVLCGINRRQVSGNAIVLGVNEAGLTAPYADVLYVDDMAGQPLARLFCHAAHAVTMGGDNLLISGDWPGYAQRGVEHHYGGDCVAMFMQGCCGNINSHPRGDFAAAEASGKQMTAAVAGGDAGTTRHSELPLAAASRPVELPLMAPPPLAEAEQQLANYVERARSAESDNWGMRRMYEGMAEWAQEIVDLARDPRPGRTVLFEIQALRVGDMGIVGLPGEVFVEYALNIDAASPLAHTAVPAYTNGNVGYVANASAYPEGGYELTGAIPFYGTTIPAPESEQIILSEAAHALAEVTAGS